MLFWLSMLACQEPFGFDRHDLRDFRIAAVTADAGQPRVAIIVDGRPWSDEAIDLRWFSIDDVGEPLGQSIGDGPIPQLDGFDWVALVATHEGEERRADIDLAGRSRFESTIATLSTPLAINGLTPNDVSLEGRPEPSTNASNTLESDGAIRVQFNGGPQDTVTRFMATGGGTFFEASARGADWFAASVTIEDEDITSEPIADGPITFVALGVAEQQSGFAQHDVFVGPPLDGSWTPHGRFVEGGITGFYTAILEPVDSVLGVRAVDVEPAVSSTPWDDGGLRCSGPQGLDLSGLLDQRCVRSELIGRRVLLQGVQ